jgi:hypothetical protein
LQSGQSRREFGQAAIFCSSQVEALSATRKNPFSVQLMLIGIVIHKFWVGLPIAVVVRKFSATLR